jgi:hypothetical protein
MSNIINMNEIQIRRGLKERNTGLLVARDDNKYVMSASLSATVSEQLQVVDHENFKIVLTIIVRSSLVGNYKHYT